jgi:hypothetical protein
LLGSEWAPVAFEQFDFAVDGKHFFDEGATEMQKTERKSALILRAQ